MKFSLSWLKSHLETEADTKTIAETLTSIGLEVEDVTDHAARLAPFTVAYVVEAKQHPNADKLRVCIVDTGHEKLQVVCGAPNARTGMKGVFAASGTTIPGTGLLLKKSMIRGQESNGMLCSEREMGLSDEHDGIIELPADTPLGKPFASVLGLDDPLFELSVTPNRGDCLGVIGIARDLAAKGLGRLRTPAIEVIPGRFKSPIDVRLEFPTGKEDACPLFVGRYIRNVKNGPSPAWMQNRLRSVGLRPISALVDVTNFLTIDLNRPVHVFDADKVKGGHLWLRLGCGGRNFRALNGKDYTLDDEMTAIGDDTGVLSLAGVMGGESSGCSDATTNVFVEIALFDPKRTATTGRKLSLDSDARHRFERGVDAAFAPSGMEAATRLILDLCGGEPSEMVMAGTEPAWRRSIAFRQSRVCALGGLDVPEAETRRLLAALGFEANGSGESRSVVPPSWRNDIQGEADIVEEVLRLKGFDAIPAVSLRRATAEPEPALDLGQRRVRLARRVLAARGLNEAVTWSFMPSGKAALFGDVSDALRVANPISADLDVMRPSILPNLLAAVARNRARGAPSIALFEVGPQYEDDTPKGQHPMASGVRAGAALPRHWQGKARTVDALDAKADAFALIQALGLPTASLNVTADAPGWYHPGRSGCVKLGASVVARFGELHPHVTTAFDLDVPVAGFELFLDALPQPKERAGRARPLLKASDFQAVERDFAFVLDRKVNADAVVRAARTADRALITDVQIFDLYEGEGLEPGKKSLAISVRLEPQDRTLTEAEIEAVAKKVVEAVQKATGGTLRA
ncbi:MAG: phenylalanine--tRNA ligase subunit beta [Alphaproteobacteria bacterium]|nr:phenylalanine--tRNA ligase subunit beta [Alphaproteobacteria bacterium]